MVIVNDKKCLECSHSKCEKYDNDEFEYIFEYICCLSKAKCFTCLSETKTENYFKEM